VSNTTKVAMATTQSFDVFVKEVGNHRGNPRLYFQNATMLPHYGFTPGVPYAIGLMPPEAHEEQGIMQIKIDPMGSRKVCKKVVGKTTYSIIDVNVAVPALTNVKSVSVSITRGLIIIRPLGVAA
jgi:hypothetical protein